ncbi:U-box domain-containing protein 26 [Benincasa hispida]|uniref:U-box domain-containing protein 26 n=1 Tax=Benincasa hispida TaxID=102211 RepID=UPI001900807D|nr:U-box domain-containing protein 26 [Benincasa hispida]
MRTHQPKLKTQLFSCGFFRHCTRSVLSPTASHSPALPSFPSASDQPPPPPHSRRTPLPDSESSSSSASQSFTQWRFPLPHSPIFTQQPSISDPPSSFSIPPSDPLPPPISAAALKEILQVAELQLCSASYSDRLAALQLLERSLVPNPSLDPDCTPELMRGLIESFNIKTGSKPATKILLALCLAEGNRHIAVEAGAVGAVIESLPEMEDAAAERALASLELMCTVAEGAAEVRAHALSVPAMVTMMGRMAARGKESAISVLGVIFDNEVSSEAKSAVTAPPEEVARAVVLALQGDSSVRGRRKGARLLKTLQEQQDGCSTEAVD